MVAVETSLLRSEGEKRSKMLYGTLGVQRGEPTEATEATEGKALAADELRAKGALANERLGEVIGAASRMRAGDTGEAQKALGEEACEEAAEEAGEVYLRDFSLSLSRSSWSLL